MPRSKFKVHIHSVADKVMVDAIGLAEEIPFFKKPHAVFT